jgi:DNA ligase (NAD+)
VLISLNNVYEETNVLRELKKAKSAKEVRQLCKDLEPHELEEIIVEENRHYHERSKPRISDLTFDVLKEQLEKVKPNSKALKQVGSPVKGEKTVLPFYMGSLDKIKPDSDKLEKWVSMYPGPYVVTDKIDGASLLRDCRTETRLFTRGKGNIGRNVTHLDRGLKLPSSPGLAVRGEIVMRGHKFDNHSDDYENPRNLVSSVLNKKEVNKKVLGDCEFIAHELLSPSISPSKGLKKLASVGYDVVWYKVLPKVNASVLTKLLEARKVKAGYDIDGLVVTQDKKNIRPNSSNPGYSVAFKVDTEDNIAEARVLGIDWQVSRLGLIKPVLLIEPTKLSGVTIKRVTAHNAKTVKENKLGKGAVISLIRSGDVIPKMLSVVKKCSSWSEPDIEWKWDANGTEALALVVHDGQKIKRISNFFNKVGVEFMKEGVVEQLFDAGFTSVKKILNATPKDFMSVEGFQSKKAQKIYDSIREKTSGVDIVTLLNATGVFGKGFGERKLRPIVERYKDVRALSTLPTAQIAKQIKELKGYSDTTAKQFASLLPKAIKRLDSLGIKYTVKEKAKPVSALLKGKSFLFTGLRSKDAEDYIENNGGTLASSVKPGLTALVVKDLLTNSSKATKARELSIPMLTFDQFRSKYWS